MSDIRELSFSAAVQEALAQAMEADERVFLMGEDIGVYGGAFQVTVHLPGLSCVTGSTTFAPSGPVIVTSPGGVSAMVRRVIVRTSAVTVAFNASSSSSGSFSIQCARRRSSSNCGPPPS